jgi:hypothetical protein
VQDKENEKDVSGKGKIEAKVFKDIHPTWSAAAGQSYEGERQGHKEYEPKKIKSSANELAQIRRASMKRSQEALKRRNILDLVLIRQGADAHHDERSREHGVDADERQDQAKQPLQGWKIHPN